VKTRIAAALAAAATIATAVPAVAQNNGYTYRGRDGRYYYHCKKSSGTTGAVAGGVGGAVIGHALGGGTLGTLAGAGGGLLLGRHLDKKHDEAQNRRNGCA
jgi:hypothetical protein